MSWHNIKGHKPPFDTLVLVRGKDKEYEFYRYAIAYNECYPPHVNMTQRLELSDCLTVTYNDKMKVNPKLVGRQAIYIDVPFEIEEWVQIS